MNCRCKIPDWNLENQRIFLRADLNVPLLDRAILDDHRIRALLPTIDLIHKKGGRIILATHIGRPTKHDKSLSTKLLISWFAGPGYSVTFCDTPH